MREARKFHFDHAACCRREPRAAVTTPVARGEIQSEPLTCCRWDLVTSVAG